MYIYHRADGVYIHGFYFFALFPLKGKKKKNNNLLGGHFLIFLCSSIFLFLVFFFPLWFKDALSGLAHGTNHLQCIYAARSRTCLLTAVAEPKNTHCHTVPFFFLLYLETFAFFLPLVMPLIALLPKRAAGKKKKERQKNKTKHRAWPPPPPPSPHSSHDAATSVALCNWLPCSYYTGRNGKDKFNTLALKPQSQPDSNAKVIIKSCLCGADLRGTAKLNLASVASDPI